MIRMKTALTILALISFLTGSAQNPSTQGKAKFFAGFSYSGGFSRSDILNRYNFRAIDQSGGLSYNVKAVSGISFHSGWQIGAGLGYSKLSIGQFYFGWTDCGNMERWPIFVSHNYNFVELPITISRTLFSKRLSPYFSFGVTPAFCFNYQAREENLLFSGATEFRTVSTSPAINRFNIATDLGIGLHYNLTERISITLQTEMRAYLVPLAPSPHRIRWASDDQQSGRNGEVVMQLKSGILINFGQGK
jgi:hypothetical protein